MSGIQARFHLTWPNFVLDVDLDLPARGVTALFGQSGSGKTTLLRCIAGLERAQQAHLCVNGEVWQDEQRWMPTHRRSIGYVFQEASLFPHLTVLGNLQYGIKRAVGAQQTSLDQAVELLGIRHLLDRKPDLLSGGERQRVGIARALALNPRLLLMDEPLAALDLKRRQEVLPYLERLHDQLQIPVLYVSHQFEEVLQLASQVVLMDQGRVLAQGDLPNISMRPELRDMVGAEAIGAVVEGQVQSIDEAAGLARVDLGRGQLNVDASSLQLGQRIRMQLLARDLILALHAPQGLSVRNMLQGVITAIAPDERHASLVTVDVGGVQSIARVTTPAAQELNLQVGLSLWVLIKAVTLRGHVYHGAAYHSTGCVE